MSWLKIKQNIISAGDTCTYTYLFVTSKELPVQHVLWLSSSLVSFQSSLFCLRSKIHELGSSWGKFLWFVLSSKLDKNTSSLVVTLKTSLCNSLLKRNCKSMGGHLASVHSSNEYRYIQKLTSDHDYMQTWIGGTYEFEVPFFYQYLSVSLNDRYVINENTEATDR